MAFRHSSRFTILSAISPNFVEPTKTERAFCGACHQYLARQALESGNMPNAMIYESALSLQRVRALSDLLDIEQNRVLLLFEAQCRIR